MFSQKVMYHNGKIDPGRLGFDIDGVVADTAEAFLRLARQDYGLGTINLDDITEFEVEDCLDIEPSIINEIFGRILAEPLTVGLKPMPDAIPVLKELARRAPLTFVTARPDQEPIDAWLVEMLGPETLTGSRLIAMGEHDEKPRYIKELKLDFFIDDRAQTCFKLDRHGITPLVYEQPWNRGRHHFQTVDNWLTIRSLCLE